MAVDKKVINYVKNQLKAGYTPDQIKTALANSGYNQADINQAIAAAGAGKAKPVKGAPAAAKPTKGSPAGAKPAAGAGMAEKPMIGFIVSLIGGILILLAAILPALGITFFNEIFEFFPAIMVSDATMTMILGLVFAVVAIIGAVLVNMRPDNKAPGLIVLVMSIIILLMGTGFFLGALLGIIGGAMAILGK